MSAGETIHAAGVVVIRRHVAGSGKVTEQTLIVHRPHREDWSLPKGKVDPGEHLLLTALRECDEETGLLVTLGPPLTTASYLDNGVPKTVRYWLAHERLDSGFTPDDEIDAIEWVDLSEIPSRLTYELDAELVREAAAIPATSPFIVLRHAKAMKRVDFDGSPDSTRPLAGRGRGQSKVLVDMLDAYGIQRIVTSPAKRCLDTVTRLARFLDLPVEEFPQLSEEGHALDPAGAAELIAELAADPRPTVLCSHRPVMPTLLISLADELGVPKETAGTVGEWDPRLAPGEFAVVHRFWPDGLIPRLWAIERHKPTRA
jgi:8-oxo-dGTP diphosphatase